MWRFPPVDPVFPRFIGYHDRREEIGETSYQPVLNFLELGVRFITEN